MAGIIFLSFWIGYYPLSPSQVIAAFFSRFGYTGEILPQAVTIFWNIHLPRILSAMFIGASLATAGSTYQGMFRNPLVSPDILGVSSGASLGAAFAILNGVSNWMVQISAFAGGVAAVAVSCLISRKSAHSQTLSFDLVFSSMTPAVHGMDNLIKSMEMSRAWCCNISPLSRHNRLGAQIIQEVFGQKPP